MWLVESSDKRNKSKLKLDYIFLIRHAPLLIPIITLALSVPIPIKFFIISI